MATTGASASIRRKVGERIRGAFRSMLDSSVDYCKTLAHDYNQSAVECAQDAYAHKVRTCVLLAGGALLCRAVYTNPTMADYNDDLVMCRQRLGMLYDGMLHVILLLCFEICTPCSVSHVTNGRRLASHTSQGG